MTQTYNQFARFIGLTWKQPKYKVDTRIPFIPTETEIDQLIASCGKHMATLLLVLKETGIRISELTLLKHKDLSPEQRTLNITPTKNSNPRILPISNKLIDMINQLPKNRETIFPTHIDNLRTSYDKQRKTATHKLQNPRLLEITFHTFRHFKGTMEYHKTKDIVHVKYVLGHKNIENTMIYINIEQALFLQQTDQFTCKTAKDINEATQLIEAGFEYITDLDGLKLFRKRK